jgi:hypothetical protein
MDIGRANQPDDAAWSVTAAPIVAAYAATISRSKPGYRSARLDRLGPAKDVAQIGAVIGREFSSTGGSSARRRRSRQ